MSRDKLTQDDLAVLAVRSIVADMCMQHGGGHGGSALGMAAIGVALWKYILRFNPADPDWFDRDRFVLSNGHASSFLYTMLHLTGYEAWDTDQLRGYTHPKENGYHTLAHGHPEREAPGVEVTTGPLGQGIANAVGLAIASKNLAATFNDGKDSLIQSRIYCMAGDGCLMEGVALEALSLAGQLQLDNLVLIYDNNQVTCDGPLDWINVENTNDKIRACGWEVIDVEDGTYDVQAIVSAFRRATLVRQRPVMINVRTVIGADTQSAGTYKAHHGLIDSESLMRMKTILQSSSEVFSVPSAVSEYFQPLREQGIVLQNEWTARLEQYEARCPQKAEALRQRMNGGLQDGFDMLNSLSSSEFTGKATREVNGIIIRHLSRSLPRMFVGGADLMNSMKITYSQQEVFDAVNHTGNFIRYGIREHAMASIANGLAAYHPGTFLPVTATFFMFYLYAAPGVRMGALSKLQVLHIASHDSFAEGQNGPTHQPVELDSLYRAMPNLWYFRPCDAEELIGAWQCALASRESPSLFSLARDAVGTIPGTHRSRVKYGAYVVLEQQNADLTIASCGSNLQHAVEAARLLSRDHQISARVVSAPCLDLFELQAPYYKDAVFPRDGKPIVSAEEYVPTVWARYATASVGMSSYGCSAANESNYARFSLDARGIAQKIRDYLTRLAGADARLALWQQL
ncbi:hypothetical protein A1O3_02154 [Capronia epimyces CBS 606.96]|uniref:Transketolase-like pyrimidine-binding domain-containing protein n=1 Tax=Capronia epimyces CBS 606.96 TaxID=1182542 RepID=W9YHF0_9EURO|nr:uncharacterized protein A1O3_02154 [Capronia epimyces CBS 606.96]EXJ89090.1 hypothetical protein A1O3_02154 [Capronia epimyces CBS 606.96]